MPIDVESTLGIDALLEEVRRRLNADEEQRELEEEPAESAEQKGTAS